ncbi:MAG: WD40 repeat domain-containing serine/threonine protein kinase [Terriglobales bacterium]
MPLAAGTRLGPYEVLAPVGAGGMGEVYRARDTRLKREVAVKVLPAAMAHDARALQRMQQEALAVAALNHPNLLSVYDVGQSAEGAPYIVSELLEGESLRRRLQTGALGQGKAIDYATQIAHGLAVAHDKGIVHRDLKPENIFLTNDGRVKILDFGLAKLSPVAGSEDVTVAEPAAAATAPGVVLGTVGYMAPEQVRGQAADARSDIFSLGAVVYEMLAGRRAFRGDSAVEVMSAILKEEPEPLSTISSGKRPALSPALERIVGHCLEKEPRQRFQSAGDVAFNLAGLSQSGSTTSALAALPAARRRAPVLGIALIVAIAVIAFLLLRPRPSAAPPVLMQVTYHRGTILGAQFLPGGQNLVFSAAWNGATSPSLYTGQAPSSPTESPSLQPLGSAHGTPVAVSSSGDIALLAIDPTYEGASLLSIIPSGGSAARPVMREILGAAFAPGTSKLAIARLDPVTGGSDIEYPAGHVLYQCRTWCNDLHFSSDGKQIAFLEHPNPGDNRGHVAVLDLGGGERRLSRDFFSSGGLGWAPGGQAIWFTAGNGINQSLYSVSLSGKLRRQWQVPSDLILDDIAPDGRVLFTSDDLRVTVRVATTADPLGQDYTVRDWSVGAVLTPDGREALIDEEVSGTTSTYQTYLRTVGPNTTPVLLGNGDAVAISPDGQWALSSLADADRTFMLLPTGPGQSRPLVKPGELQFVGVVSWFLPNSGAVVTIARKPGRPYRTWLISLDGSMKSITPPGIYGSWPTPDGKYVLGETVSSRQWALYPLAGGSAIPEPAIASGLRPVGFGASDSQLYVGQRNGLSVALYSLDLHGGQRKLLAIARPPDLAGASGAALTSVSRDGKTFAYDYGTMLSTLYVARGVH